MEVRCGRQLQLRRRRRENLRTPLPAEDLAASMRSDDLVLKEELARVAGKRARVSIRTCQSSRSMVTVRRHSARAESGSSGSTVHRSMPDVRVVGPRRRDDCARYDWRSSMVIAPVSASWPRSRVRSADSAMSPTHGPDSSAGRNAGVSAGASSPSTRTGSSSTLPAVGDERDQPNGFGRRPELRPVRRGERESQPVPAGTRSPIALERDLHGRSDRRAPSEPASS